MANNEEKDPLFSSTSVDGHDDELDGHWRPYQNRTQVHRREHRKLWNAAYLLCGVLVGVVGLLLIQQATSTALDRQIAKPHGAATLNAPLVETIFERHELFSAPPSVKADEAWSSLMPFGDGFVAIGNSQKLGLPPGIQSPEGEKYDISMFHQLHCLKQIRETLYISRIALNTTNAANIDETMIQPSMSHIYHCFDYIRQAIMCAGDMTFEWPRTEDDGSRFAVDGWGVTHQCKNWEAISEYMTRNRQLP